MRMHLAVTDYGNFLQNEPSPLQTMVISEKCTERLVDEFNYLRCNASDNLAKVPPPRHEHFHCRRGQSLVP